MLYCCNKCILWYRKVMISLISYDTRKTTISYRCRILLLNFTGNNSLICCFQAFWRQQKPKYARCNHTTITAITRFLAAAVLLAIILQHTQGQGKLTDWVWKQLIHYHVLFLATSDKPFFFWWYKRNHYRHPTKFKVHWLCCDPIAQRVYQTIYMFENHQKCK